MSKYFSLLQIYFPLVSFLLITTLINFTVNLHAQSDVKFKRFTTENGLPANYALEIFQDNRGFIWVGLRGAICRFDGVNFRTFPVETARGLKKLKTSITNIDQDAQNRIWIGEIGQYGLLQFDDDREVFINHFEKLKLPKHLKKININSLLCDRQGIVWLGIGNYGIILYDPDTEQVQHLKHDPDNPNSIPPGVYNNLLEGDDGIIWIGTSTFLYKYNKIQKKTKKYTSLGAYGVFCVFKDSKNQIWASISGNGLHKYNKETDDFKRLFYDPDDIEHSIVDCYKVAEDEQSRLWIGTNNGICISDKQKKSFVRYKTDEKNDESINSNIIKTILLDKTGNMWICTSEGIAKQKINKFKTYRYSASSNSISHNKVQYFLEYKPNKIWISVPDGIDFFDKTSGKFIDGLSKINRFENKITEPPIVFCKDPGKGIWIGTYGGGLFFLDESTQKLSSYETDPDKPFSLSSNVVFSLCIDSKNNFWVGTWGGGLNLFHKKTGRFKHFLYRERDSTSLPSNYIRKIFEDSRKNIWIGMVGGVAVLKDIGKATFYNVLSDKLPDIGIEISAYDFAETENGKYIWIATNIGLIKYNNIIKEIVIYNEKDGLPSSQIYSVLTDKKEALWLSSDNGLIHFDHKQIVKSYDRSDGLQGNEFLPSSRCRLHDGTMLFGGLRGFSMFHPDSVFENIHPPDLAFTGLEIANKPVEVGQVVNQQIILNKSISKQEHLIFNHSNNNFSIEFIALHFSQPQKNKYAYKLENFDKDWNYTSDSKRKASYMNLPGGNYNLKVKASNCDGVWNEEGISMKITVLEPWWKSLWFSLISLGFMMTLFLLIIKLRTSNLQRQKQKLEKIVKERTIELQEMNLILTERKDELELQMKQLEKMNIEIEQMAHHMHEADQSKLRFFANISHEFRTPLTLIAAPLEKLLQNPSTVDWNKVNIWVYLKLMHKNSKRLLRLVNQIMDFRKIDQKRKELNISHNNIVDFIKDVISAFEDVAEAKGIQLKVKSEELRVKSKEQSIQNPQSLLITHHSSLYTQFWFDPDIMEKILFNLISNAIKYTPEGGEIIIQLRVKNEEIRVKKKENQNTQSPLFTLHSTLFIEIKDTGIGIKPENIDKIFDRFYRVDNEESNRQHGAGIGLAYTREMVELHKGNIFVESKPGVGSVFTVRFPIEKRDEKVVNDLENQKSFQLSYIQSMISLIEENNNFSINEQPGSSQQKTNSSEAQKILIVEDNSDLRNFIRSELENKYIVYEAENGEKGWEQAITVEPDLIISDIMMPVMNGIELCKKIKTDENICHIPVILLTAKSGDEDTIFGFETGADDYIAKPFNILILIARIQGILKTRKLLHEKFSTSPLNSISNELSVSALDKKFLDEATNIINENISNPDFNIEVFVRQLNFSRSFVYKKIKALTGQSISEFIHLIKLNVSVKYLLETNLSIKEIAYLVGFKHRQNYSDYFNSTFGMSPLNYRRKHKNKDSE